MSLPIPPPAWRDAVIAYQRGDAAAAATLAERVLDAMPDHFEALHLLGSTRLNLGQPAAALAPLRSAAALRPADARMQYLLGTASLAAGELPAAQQALLAATAHAEFAADSWFRLGLALGRAEDFPTAAAALLRAARLQPDNAQALVRVAECAQQLLRRGRRAPAPAPTDGVSGLISFVVCSITPARIVRLRARLATLFGDTGWELLVIDDAHSLCEGYARGVAASRGDWLVLCHDDVRLPADDFAARLRRGLAQYELFGVAGATRIAGPAWGWAGTAHAHCWIAHPDANGRPQMLLVGSRGAAVDDAVLLDGVFLAGARRVFVDVGFDAETFDGFHFYDLDFSYRAASRGVRCGIRLDLALLHESGGTYDEAYVRYGNRFVAKFAAARSGPHARLTLGQLPLADEAELAPIQDWLAHWTGESDERLERRVRERVAGASAPTTLETTA